MADEEIDEPFDRLVEIEIEGKRFRVPEDNVLLRCVQYLVDEDVVLGRLCWNDECGHCELSLRSPGAPEPVRARACRTLLQDGMSLSELTPDLRYWLARKLG